MSDCVRLSDETCPCGRPFALLDGIEGRREDILDLPGTSGHRVQVHPNVFHDVLDLVSARAWQVVQGRDDVLHVLLAGATRETEDAPLRSSLEAALSRKGAVPADILVERVVAIPRTRVGKARLVRRESADWHGT